MASVRAERIARAQPIMISETVWDSVPRECGLIIEKISGKFEVVRSLRAKRTEASVWNLLNLILKPPGMRPANF